MAHKGMKGSKMSEYGKGKEYDMPMKEGMGKMMKPMMGGKKPKK